MPLRNRSWPWTPPVVCHLVVKCVPEPQWERQRNSAERLERDSEPFCNAQNCLPASPQLDMVAC